MKSFLKQVASYLITNYKNQLYDIAVIFPGKRSKLFLNKYISEISDSPVWSPAYFTINELLENLSGLILADEINLNLILYKTLSNNFDYISFTENFFHQTTVLLNDFDDIDKYLIDINTLFSNIFDLKEIETKFDYLTDKQKEIVQQFWNVVENKTPIEGREKFLHFWQKLPDIYFQFNSLLDKLQIAYEGKIYRKVAEEIKEGNNNLKFDYKLYIFTGFNALTPSEKIIFRHLKKEGKAIFLWDYDQYYINEFHEAGYFIKENIKEFPSPENWTDDNFNNISKPEKEIFIISVPSKLYQINTLPFIFKNIKTEKNFSPDNTAIILPDDSILLNIINNIPENIEEINISSGYSLSQTNWYSLLLDFFEIIKNKKNINNKTFFYYKDFLKILQNPLWKYFENYEEFIKVLSEKIIYSNLIYVNENLINDIPIIKNFLLIEKNNTLIRHLLDFFSYVFLFFTQENKKLINDIEIIALEKIIHFLRRFDDMSQNINIDATNDISLFKYFLFIVKKQKLNFSGEPLKGLQILGLLESRTLDFENVIIFSMNEGIIPSSKKPITFIPLNLRYAYKLPVIDHHDAIYAYYFYRLLQRSNKIFLIHYNSTLSTNAEEKSRFIQQLEFEFPHKLKFINFIGKISVVTEQKISIDKKINKIKSKLQQLTSNSWFLTPSAINTYIRCPLQFYYRYIEEIPEKKIISETPDATDFGTAIHKSLKEIYSPFVKKTITTKDLENIANENIENNIRKSLLEIYGEDYKLEGYYLIAFEVMKKYIKTVIDYDKNYTPFQLLGLEQKFTIQLKINENYSITLGGTIDRIDQKDRNVRIIDYKTGLPENSISNLNDLFDPLNKNRKENILQIFIYSYLYAKNNNSKNIYPALFFIRDMISSNFSPFIKLSEQNKEENSYINIENVQFDLEKYLINIISDIINEDLPFYQTKNIDNCKYCQFNIICKRKV